MEKFIAVVFDTEEAAYKGADAMRDLHRDGELAVYAAGIIAKDNEGNVEVKKSADEGPIGTAFGLMLGAMVGVLAGPAAVASGAAVAGSAAAAQAAAGGMALGSMTGGVFGAYRDLWVSGVDVAMLDNVAVELLPGKYCIVASVDEVWTAPLDVKMKESGGTIFRKLRTDAVDEQIEAEMVALDKELTAMEDELDEAADEMAADIKEGIDKTKTKVKETNDRIDARLDEIDAEFDARLDAIDQQIDSATENSKARFQKRKAEIQEEYSHRKALLSKAAELAGEALG